MKLTMKTLHRAFTIEEIRAMSSRELLALDPRTLTVQTVEEIERHANDVGWALRNWGMASKELVKAYETVSFNAWEELDRRTARTLYDLPAYAYAH